MKNFWIKFFIFFALLLIAFPAFAGKRIMLSDEEAMWQADINVRSIEQPQQDKRIYYEDPIDATFPIFPRQQVYYMPRPVYFQRPQYIQTTQQQWTQPTPQVVEVEKQVLIEVVPKNIQQRLSDFTQETISLKVSISELTVQLERSKDEQLRSQQNEKIYIRELHNQMEKTLDYAQQAEQKERRFNLFIRYGSIIVLLIVTTLCGISFYLSSVITKLNNELKDRKHVT